jgi:hypothetical protein
VKRLVGEDGLQRLYVPLEDVVTAFGGRLEENQSARTFSIKIQNYRNTLLEYVPPDEAHKES